ncbi:unnamed protein product [Bursaphelenchus okinawaensis]|uniref:G_PROTEIN_RECEP_F1_2 domain-containing protein n=1 Tax=Bursaphelenchus okinawaensis TaxID=465554 RepID=A0A811KHA2_9BILA|nr:unnamed protein product [Bursaphelenchus okinawaensis]CAG9103161.1 unnamed protein product [Bursaphelenchus okinawaensis]
MTLAVDELPSKDFLNLFLKLEKYVIISTVSVVFVTLIVMNMSVRTTLKRYHYYLVNEILCSLLGDIVLYLIGPIVLYPEPCFMLSGLLASNKQYDVYILLLFIATLNARGSALMLQFFSRVTQSMSPRSKLYINNCNVKNQYIIIGFVVNVVFGAIITAAPFCFPTASKAARTELTLNLTSLLQSHYQKSPNIYCFDATSSMSKAFIPIICIFVSVPIVGHTMLCMIYYYITTSNFAVKTKKLQLMLLWSLIAQSIGIFVFLCGPCYIVLIAPYFATNVTFLIYSVPHLYNDLLRRADSPSRAYG